MLWCLQKGMLMFLVMFFIKDTFSLNWVILRACTLKPNGLGLNLRSAPHHLGDLDKWLNLYVNVHLPGRADDNTYPWRGGESYMSNTCEGCGIGTDPSSVNGSSKNDSFLFYQIFENKWSQIKPHPRDPFPRWLSYCRRPSGPEGINISKTENSLQLSHMLSQAFLKFLLSDASIFFFIKF